MNELVTELRHKFLTILKSVYWENFEEGQCVTEAVVVLLESADRALDHEDMPMADWAFIKTYIVSDRTNSLLSGLAKIPLIGRFFQDRLFNNFSLAYDIIVNFIEGHEHATHAIRNFIHEQNFVSQILKESSENVQQAEAYMASEIEEDFPDISKAI